jgi:sec-independent protein translocase protein TatB
MFEIGWTELLLIGVVALIVIGPKDLPEMFRTLGRFTAKARSMARDFQRAMDQAVDNTGVKDMAKDLKTATSAKGLGLDAVKDAASKFEKWDPLKTTPKPAMPVAPVVQAAAAATAPEPTAPKPLGPETQALADRQAARSAIAREAADKLRLASSAPVIPVAAPAPVAELDPVAAAARKPRAVKPKAMPDNAPAAIPKPRAPRKKPKADEV